MRNWDKFDVNWREKEYAADMYEYYKSFDDEDDDETPEERWARPHEPHIYEGDDPLFETPEEAEERIENFIRQGIEEAAREVFKKMEEERNAIQTN